MRLHHLEITAFGPFADTATVDFDALSDAGLFLLTGATGAGKTSILDAVCFALYGEVPGDRQSAKRLRADQAADGVAPRVTLELSLGGRRFRLVRSPAWERPKKRGTGTTVEQASVRLFEQVSSGWTLLSSRLDETGHQVTHLVGMNLTQFCQVAMLPQGRFQAFLRARSDERHQLLQQLFRTTRFEQIERWLRDRRRDLRRASDRHHEVVADLVSRVSEAADAPLPDQWDLHDLVLPASGGDVERWSATHRDGATDLAVAASTRASEATNAVHAARASLDQGRTLADLQAAHAAAAAERRVLDEAEPERRARVERLAAARRACGVLPLHEVAARQVAARADAERESEERSAAVAELLGAIVVGDLEATHAVARDAVAAARALLPREHALARLTATIAADEAQIDELMTRADEVAEQVAGLPAALEAARQDHEQAIEAGRTLLAVRADLAALVERQDAAARVVTLTRELAEARELLVGAVDECQRLTESWLSLREERLNGMAAEIAGALAVGADCPVCGSVDHPHPASPRPGAPDAAAEKAARRLVDDAEVARLARDDKVRDLQTRLALAEQQAGSPADDLATAIDSARADESRLARVAASAERLAARLAALDGDRERLAAERESVSLALTAARAALSARRAEAAGLADEIRSALEGSGCASVAELLEQQEALAAESAAAVEAAAAHRRAWAAERDAVRRAEEAAAAAGFDSVDDALAAALDDATVLRLDRQVTADEAVLARLDAVLADPAVRAAAAVPAPDLAALTQRHAQVESELAEARTQAALAEARARRLTGLDDELRSALAAWAPLRSDLLLVTRMAALTDGTSPDNRLQMRLSGYVLAWRLTQVVAAANERLGRMSDQRYSLEHTGKKGAGETRGGLSLVVRDDWSGETRDPATLSGGETFVVSLALALGLADVIAHEVGGTDLDTLFVDEGFGSLDADTLDDVMDTLDSLRDGGRVVGVVSHVAEMRDRIPAQLRVAKSRRGSTVSLAR